MTTHKVHAKRTCLECGATYTPTSASQKSCSTTCSSIRTARRNAHRNGWTHSTERATTTCTICAATYAPKSNRQKTCSDECSQRLKAGREWPRHLLRRHGLTEQDREAMVVAQDGRCAICATTTPGGSQSAWHIDHDHACCPQGRSCDLCRRGLLCSRCNVAIGLMADNPALLRAAAQYLDGHR